MYFLKKIVFFLFLLLCIVAVSTTKTNVAFAQSVITPEFSPCEFGGLDTPKFQLDHKIFDTASMPFVTHPAPPDKSGIQKSELQKNKSYNNWLALNVPYSPVENLKKSIASETGE